MVRFEIMRAGLFVAMMFHLAAGDLLEDCKADPTNATCTNSANYYTDAMVTADVEKLCMAMPQMPSCVIRDYCSAGSIAASSGHCGNWNFLAGVCSTQYGEKMQGMAGCMTYKMICAANSVVDSCSDATKQGPVDLITTEEARDGALAQCQEDNALMLEISPAYMGDGHDMEHDEHDGHDHGHEHEDGDEHDDMNRRAMTKVCDMCDATRCTVGLHILSAGCVGDMGKGHCAELKKMCDANTGLGPLCVEAAGSGGAALVVRSLLPAAAAAVAVAMVANKF